MSETKATVQIERAGAVAILTLDRPDAANALSRTLVAELRAALRDLQTDPALAVVVLTGAGPKAFSAGADLKERRQLTLDETRGFLDQLNQLMNELAGFPRAVIAALNGVAFGGGLELALACDLRVGAAGIEVGLPEVRLGIIPGAGGTQRLARLVGVAIAKELILTGRRISAERAHALGLLTAVAAPESLRETALALAGEIALGGPLAVAQAKRAIDEGLGLTMGEALAVERAAYEVVLTSADRNEGLEAFAEKRRPKWQGK